jgi:hypothetical protein
MVPPNIDGIAARPLPVGSDILGALLRERPLHIADLEGAAFDAHASPFCGERLSVHRRNVV